MENRQGPFAGLNLESAIETTDFTDGTDGRRPVSLRCGTRQESLSVIGVAPKRLYSCYPCNPW
jgi:hypothetical protein